MGMGDRMGERGGKEIRRKVKWKKTGGQIRISSLRRGDVIARILLDKYLTFEAIHHFANEQRSVLLSHPFFFLEQLFERSFLLNIKHDSKRFFSFIIAFPLTGEGIFINLVEFYVAIYLNARRIIEKKN